MSPRFCPKCGNHSAVDDRFCSNCGAPLTETQNEPAASPNILPVGRPRRRSVAIVASLALLVVIAAVAVVVIDSVEGDSDKRAQQTENLREQAKPQFDELMDNRDSFFEVERRYLAAITDANGDIRSYRRAERDYTTETKRIRDEFASQFDQCSRFDVPCPDPTYPDVPKVPSFGKQIKSIRSAASDLTEFQAQLSSMTPHPELQVLLKQLSASVESLKMEADHNADVLDEAVTPGGADTSGMLDDGKVRTLRKDQAVPSIRQMNAAAVAVIRKLGLPLGEFDVPGGRDLDSQDHSAEA